MRLVRNMPELRTSAMTVAISPGAKFGNRPGIEPVFVAEGQIMKQVVDGVDALVRENAGQSRANALDVLNGCARFQHLNGC